MRSLLVPVIVFCALVSARAAQSQERGGFTLLLTLGYGIQTGGFVEETAEGIGGLNFGIGGFISDDTALMFRLSGTNVSYEYDLPFGGGTASTDVVSGVAVFDVQYWATKRLNVEVGAGFGVVDQPTDDTGLGLLAGIGYTVLLRGKYSLQLGIEYAPVFVDETIHNVGFNVGFQFL